MNFREVNKRLNELNNQLAYQELLELQESVKNKASETVGGGFFGELLASAVDIGTQKADGKLSGFLGLFGNSDEYFHPSRGSINTFRNLLLIAMIISMLYIS